jgi:hypothetical protein
VGQGADQSRHREVAAAGDENQRHVDFALGVAVYVTGLIVMWSSAPSDLKLAVSLLRSGRHATHVLSA